jgi:hypothetical protein
LFVVAATEIDLAVSGGGASGLSNPIPTRARDPRSQRPKFLENRVNALARGLLRDLFFPGLRNDV